MSFKVIDVGTTCAFLLVNLLTYIVFHTDFQSLRSTGQLIIAFARACLSLCSRLGNLCEYSHKSYIVETRFFGLHFYRIQWAYV